MSRCPKRKIVNPRTGDEFNYEHCWHLNYSESWTGLSSGKTEEYRCCMCGERKIQKYNLATPPGHGKYAPLDWVEIIDE